MWPCEFQFNNYTSFFELFAALLLAYTGLKEFRDFVSFTYLKPWLDRLTRELVWISKDVPIEPRHRQKLLLLRIKGREEGVIVNGNHESRIALAFKSAFAITGLFCVVLLIQCVYSHFLVCPDDEFVMVSGYLMWLVLPFNLIVFVSTFIRKFLTRPLSIKLPMACFGVMLIWLFICFQKPCDELTYALREGSCQATMTQIILVAISPFMLLLLRLTFRGIYYRFQVALWTVRFEKTKAPRLKYLHFVEALKSPLANIEEPDMRTLNDIAKNLEMIAIAMEIRWHKKFWTIIGKMIRQIF